MVTRGAFYGVVVVLVALLLVSASLAVIFYGEYQTASGQNQRYVQELRGLPYQVRMVVDFGNGTAKWYNDTKVQPGSNGFLVTLVLLDGQVQATWYPQYGEHLVSGLEGVNATSSKTWFLLSYNNTASWQVASVGADDLPINNGTIFGWALCAQDANYNPTCRLP